MARPGRTERGVGRGVLERVDEDLDVDRSSRIGPHRRQALVDDKGAGMSVETGADLLIGQPVVEGDEGHAGRGRPEQRQGEGQMVPPEVDDGRGAVGFETTRGRPRPLGQPAVAETDTVGRDRRAITHPRMGHLEDETDMHVRCGLRPSVRGGQRLGALERELVAPDGQAPRRLAWCRGPRWCRPRRRTACPRRPPSDPAWMPLGRLRRRPRPRERPRRSGPGHRRGPGSRSPRHRSPRCAAGSRPSLPCCVPSARVGPRRRADVGREKPPHGNRIRAHHWPGRARRPSSDPSSGRP